MPRRYRGLRGLVALVPALAVAGCGSAASSTSSTQAAGVGGRTLTVTSSAFAPGGTIPARYTCSGARLSPPLQWSGVPSETAELFVLAVDLSGVARDTIQWAVAGIPPGVGGLSAGKLPVGVVLGTNSAGRSAWGGICGAKGQLHKVAFLLFALRRKLGLSEGFDPIVVRGELKPLTLAAGLVLGTYRRS